MSLSLIHIFFIYGHPLKPHLIGIIGIDVQGVQKALERKNPEVRMWTGEQLVENLNTDRKLRCQLLTIINRYTVGLQGFEKMHNIHVGLEPLTVEDDVITPTLKIKRMNATKKFKEILDVLYEDGSLVKEGKL